MTRTYYPSKVERHDQLKELAITWQTGERLVLPYRDLRGYCPCAGCQGHMVREVRFLPPRGHVQPLVISPVGNYALSILWSDGHSTGIYRFDFLAGLEARIRNRKEQEERDRHPTADTKTEDGAGEP